MNRIALHTTAVTRCPVAAVRVGLMSTSAAFAPPEPLRR